MSEEHKLNSVSVVCSCGLTIPDEEIEYSNGSNEESDEYYEGTAECKCGEEYVWSVWGYCDSLTEAKEHLAEHIKQETKKRKERN